jgi:acetyl-CoA synthetase
MQPRQRFGIAQACLEAQPAEALALLVDRGAGVQPYTFGDLHRLAMSAAADLLRNDAAAGARVAIMLPQGVEFAAALLGAIRAGLIAVPISSQFGPDGLAYRLRDAQAQILVTDAEGSEKLEVVRDRLDGLPRTIRTDSGEGWPASPPARSEPVVPDAESPAVIMYTSGSTGNPKGVLHAQRALLGQAPGLRLAVQRSPAGRLFWTPADWPWVTLALLGIWLQGRPVLAAPYRRFDPEWAWSVMARNEVRLAFLTPTALRMLKQSPRDAAVRLEMVMSGGEPIGEDLYEWCQGQLGGRLIGVYGQTEADILIGDSHDEPATPGAMGHAYPGHQVAVVDADGRAVERGRAGELVLRVPDAALMLEYWRQPEASARKVRDGWMWTGDEVVADERDRLWFQHRTDDIIKSAGYRIGPGEIEEMLLGHPAVANVAVIGAPDPVRGQVVKAVVQLASGASASPSLEAELRERVRGRLASYQYPRRFEFLSELPVTTTGKVNRAELRRREPDRSRGGGGAGVQGR